MGNCSRQTLDLACRLIDQFPVLDWFASYGRLGLLGRLGYENQQVRVQGRAFQHSVSAHAPSEVRFMLPPGDGSTLCCEVALNDDVAARRTGADFLVLADNRVLAAGSWSAPREPARKLTARLRGLYTLSLRVETSHRDYCHSVWLDPCWENQTTSPDAPWRDALGRVESWKDNGTFKPTMHRHSRDARLRAASRSTVGITRGAWKMSCRRSICLRGGTRLRV